MAGVVYPCTGIREYAEGYDVAIGKEGGRWVVCATNEGGYNGTRVDLRDLLDWVYENMSDEWRNVEREAD